MASILSRPQWVNQNQWRLIWNWTSGARPLHWHGLTLIATWISNDMPSKMSLWYEITYPFLHTNGCPVEVWKWISDFISQFYNRCNYLSMLGFKLKVILVKGVSGWNLIMVPEVKMTITWISHYCFKWSLKAMNIQRYQCQWNLNQTTINFH